MTNQEKKRLSAVLRATECLFLENIALKLVLEHREVPNWEKLLDHLLADKGILAGVRLKFRDVYRNIGNPQTRDWRSAAFLADCRLRRNHTKPSDCYRTY